MRTGGIYWGLFLFWKDVMFTKEIRVMVVVLSRPLMLLHQSLLVSPSSRLFFGSVKIFVVGISEVG
jgi:hypothetical protein